MDSSGTIPLTAREAGLVGCTRCGLAQDINDRCIRCGSRLQSRMTKSQQRVWAWLAAGIITYIPANIYPMLITRALLHEQENTIVGGVFQLAQQGSYGIAAIILVASVGIPLCKFAAIAALAIGVSRGGSLEPHGRLRLFEIVEFIGRWSMVDVFVVAILAALVQLNTLASIHPGPAAVTFAMSVIFTMLAAQSFEPRLIWDKTQRKPNS
jgi:paraquat-inducible protein A